jgi:hypothetical protein
MTMPKGWKPSSKKAEEGVTHISPYSPDRGTLPEGWVHSSEIDDSNPGDMTQPNRRKKTKDRKKKKPYSSSSYRSSPKPMSQGSMIGIAVVAVRIIWLIIGAAAGLFGFWWYYIMFFSLLGTALGSKRAWRSGYYASGMNG